MYLYIVQYVYIYYYNYIILYILLSDRDRFWPNRTEPRFSWQQYGRTEIYRDFLGANMAEPRFTKIAKYAAEPNRTEIAENY